MYSTNYNQPQSHSSSYPSTSSTSSNNNTPLSSPSNQTTSRVTVALRIRPPHPSSIPAKSNSHSQKNGNFSFNYDPSQLNAQQTILQLTSPKTLNLIDPTALKARQNILKSTSSITSETSNDKSFQTSYSFDYIYPPPSSHLNPRAHGLQQIAIFEDLGVPAVVKSLKGFNVSIFAYGQTGSGKSYTMMGGGSDSDREGLIPRVCSTLFSNISETIALSTSSSRLNLPQGQPPIDAANVSVSYYEIYNETVRDLLSSTYGTNNNNSNNNNNNNNNSNNNTTSFSNKASSKSKNPIPPNHSTLKVREHPVTGTYIQGLKIHPVKNYREVRLLIREGDRSRTTVSTKANKRSSRSHAVFCLWVELRVCESDSMDGNSDGYGDNEGYGYEGEKSLPSVIKSKISLIDLAGSERVKHTGATGHVLLEASNINRSLAALGDVIKALARPHGHAHGHGHGHGGSHGGNSYGGGGGGSNVNGGSQDDFIPYRNSLLTYLLKSSLGGNAITIMIATITSDYEYYDETLSTLKYANEGKRMINHVKVNKELIDLNRERERERVQFREGEERKKRKGELEGIRRRERDRDDQFNRLTNVTNGYHEHNSSTADTQTLTRREGRDYDFDFNFNELREEVKRLKDDQETLISLMAGRNDLAIGSGNNSMIGTPMNMSRISTATPYNNKHPSPSPSMLQHQHQHQHPSSQQQSHPILKNLNPDPQFTETLSYPLQPGCTTLGSSPSSTVIIKDVEFRHCIFSFEPESGVVYIACLGGARVYVNGVRLYGNSVENSSGNSNNNNISSSNGMKNGISMRRGKNQQEQGTAIPIKNGTRIGIGRHHLFRLDFNSNLSLDGDRDDDGGGGGGGGGEGVRADWEFARMEIKLINGADKSMRRGGGDGDDSGDSGDSGSLELSDYNDDDDDDEDEKEDDENENEVKKPQLNKRPPLPKQHQSQNQNQTKKKQESTPRRSTTSSNQDVDLDAEIDGILGKIAQSKPVSSKFSKSRTTRGKVGEEDERGGDVLPDEFESIFDDYDNDDGDGGDGGDKNDQEADEVLSQLTSKIEIYETELARMEHDGRDRESESAYTRSSGSVGNDSKGKARQRMLDRSLVQKPLSSPPSTGAVNVQINSPYNPYAYHPSNSPRLNSNAASSQHQQQQQQQQNHKFSTRIPDSIIPLATSRSSSNTPTAVSLFTHSNLNSSNNNGNVNNGNDGYEYEYDDVQGERDFEEIEEAVVCEMMNPRSLDSTDVNVNIDNERSEIDKLKAEIKGGDLPAQAQVPVDSSVVEERRRKARERMEKRKASGR